MVETLHDDRGYLEVSCSFLLDLEFLWVVLVELLAEFFEFLTVEFTTKIGEFDHAPFVDSTLELSLEEFKVAEDVKACNSIFLIKF